MHRAYWIWRSVEDAGCVGNMADIKRTTCDSQMTMEVEVTYVCVMMLAGKMCHPEIDKSLCMESGRRHTRDPPGLDPRRTTGCIVDVFLLLYLINQWSTVFHLVQWSSDICRHVSIRGSRICSKKGGSGVEMKILETTLVYSRYKYMNIIIKQIYIKLFNCLSFSFPFFYFCLVSWHFLN